MSLMTTPLHHSRVHAQVVFSRVLVATSFTVGVAITHELAPETLTFVRFVLAALLFAPFVAWRHGLSYPGHRALGGYALIALSIVGFFWCMFEALRHTSALNAGALHTLVPGISAIYAYVLVRERLRRYQLVALAFGLLGALTVVFRGDVSRVLAMEIGYGDLIFLCGCLSMGLYTPLVSRFHRGEPAAVISFWVLVTGAGWLLLANNTALLTVPWRSIAPTAYWGIAYLAVFTTLLTFFIMQHATLYLGPTRVVAYGYLTPALIVLIEGLLGKSLPDAGTLAGVAAILLAMVIVQRGAGNPTRPPAACEG